jgi:uncharacterized protein
MKTRSPLLWMVALPVSAACTHVQGMPPADAPRPGVPQEERTLLQREYSFDDTQCTRTAEEVVEMDHRCSETRWADCVYAATMYLRGCGVAENVVQAEALFQRACGFGSVLGCSMAGVLAKDYTRSIGLLEKPCALGYSAACGNLGLQLFNRGMEADVARATQLLETACHEGRLHYCSVVGDLVIRWKIERRFEGTRALLEHACQAQDLRSCYTLARTLEDGSLGTVDYNRAAALNWHTCYALDYLPSCDSLGYNLVLGRGYEKDPQKGVMLFYMGCNRGYGPSCDRLGEATENGWAEAAKPSNALQYYDRGCALGVESACQSAKRLRTTKSIEPAGN